MSTGFEDQTKVAALPSEGVHCFAASAKQISTRRIVTIILMVAFIGLAVGGCLMSELNVIMLGAGIVGFIVSLLVFLQTFLITKFRVAVDYNEKKIVLRYRFSTIDIPFENFDAREGEPDMAEELLDNSALGGNEKTYYLVLDNVFEEACFQTSNKDLASNADFFKLKEECLAIADAYGARNDENAIKPIDAKHGGIPVSAAKTAGEDAPEGEVDEKDKEIDDIVRSVGVDVVDVAAEEASEAKEAAEEIAEEVSETAEEKAEEVAEKALEATEEAASEVTE